MADASRPRLSIIVPNYKTRDITQLCLRALRQHTRQSYEVIVVDNNSADESLEWLRSLDWIRLIENPDAARGSLAHRQALDLGVAASRGEWVLLFHSDTIVLRGGWDAALTGKAEAANAIGFSTLCRDVTPFAPLYRRLHLRLNDRVRLWRRGLKPEDAKVMSYCMGVRGDFLRNAGFVFSDHGEAVTDFYRAHVRGQHPFLLLGRGELEPLMWHINSVTSVVVKDLTNERTVSKVTREMNKALTSPALADIHADATLDQ